MKTVRLYAYLRNNLGDDLMVKILLERYKNLRFYYGEDGNIRNRSLLVLPNFLDKEHIYERYGRWNHLVSILSFGSLPNAVFHHRFQKILKECIGSVYIGGSLFNSHQGESPEQRIAREKSQVSRTPYFVVGCNFNPKESRSYIDAFREFFASVAGVSFRDRASYELFQELPNAQYASDVVFNLDIRRYQGAEKNNTVLISVVDCEQKQYQVSYTEVYETAIVKICEAAILRGLTPVLMSFCKFEGDETAITRILDRTPGGIREQIRVYHYEDNIDEALSLYSRAQCVVATRFHAMILAMLFELPFFVVSYNDKVRHVLQDFQMDCYCDMDTVKDLDGENVFKRMQRFSKIDQARADSSRQFQQFEAFVNQLY